jgi:hypothetical protein
MNEPNKLWREPIDGASLLGEGLPPENRSCALNVRMQIWFSSLLTILQTPRGRLPTRRLQCPTGMNPMRLVHFRKLPGFEINVPIPWAVALRREFEMVRTSIALPVMPFFLAGASALATTLQPSSLQTT